MTRLDRPTGLPLCNGTPEYVTHIQQDACTCGTSLWAPGAHYQRCPLYADAVRAADAIIARSDGCSYPGCPGPADRRADRAQHTCPIVGPEWRMPVRVRGTA